jgi:hypothetical protein
MALTREETVARSLRTQQRAYDRYPTPGLRSTHPPEGMQYWEPATRAGRTGQCSTLEHRPGHQQPPGMRNRHGPSTALDHQHEAGGQCSLERR